MLKRFGIALAVATTFSLSGCLAAAGMTPVTGFLYSDVSGPISATNATGAPTLTGTASCQSILGLIATGDCSIMTAARNGNITQIHAVDYHNSTILGIIATITVTVHGQ